MIDVDSGASKETVQVKAVNTTVPPPQITADFTQAHVAGVAITINSYPGNPGPQPSFDYRFNTGVIPYLNIIY